MKLREELEEARQIVNSERHNLIFKKHLVGLSGSEEERFDFLQGKIKEWWPRSGRRI